LRGDGGVTRLAPGITSLLGEIDPELPIRDIRSMDELVATTLSQQRSSMWLFAALAFLLAAVGIYSVLTYSIRSRVSEISIRMALGASPADVLRLVIAEGMKPTLLGINASCRYQYVVFDRDAKFGGDVFGFLKTSGLKPIHTSVRSPWQNGVAERWVGSCRREMLDHVIPLNEQHLRRLGRDYLTYYHEDRTTSDWRRKRRHTVRLNRARPSVVSLGRHLESAVFTIDIPGRQRPDWSRVPSDESSNANWPGSWFDRAEIRIATSQAAVSQPLPRRGAARRGV